MDVKLTSYDLSYYNDCFTTDNLGTSNAEKQEPITTQYKVLPGQPISEASSNFGSSQGISKNKFNQMPSRMRSNSVVGTVIRCNSGKDQFAVMVKHF